MAEYHIGSKGVEVIFPAGYLNRAARRRMKKLGLSNVHSVINNKPIVHENKEESKNVDAEQH